jgi:hypothetical protein
MTPIERITQKYYKSDIKIDLYDVEILPSTEDIYGKRNPRNVPTI